MATRLNPYLNFNGNAREAMTHYQSVLGGELTVSTYGEFQMGGDSESGKVMHAELAGGGLTLMGADTPDGMEYSTGSNFAVALFGDDEPELRGYFDGLAEGGTVTLPLEQAPWGDSFGQLVDKFGVSWMVNISGASS